MPKPTLEKRNAEQRDILDAEDSKLVRPTHLLPVHKTMPSIALIFALPKEGPDQLVDLRNQPFAGSKS